MLEFRGVSKRFGALSALDDCTLTARPGRLTGFLGPNGAGKTTAMRAVFGLVALDSGEVLWRGAPVGPAEWSRFGYMPEERGLYPRMRVRDQLIYLGRLSGRSRSQAGSTVDTWLERLGLAARGRDRVDALSHGNQQRVQLIAALVNEPELLVLDEPSSLTTPLIVVLVAGYFVSFAAIGSPDTWWARLASWFPATAPFAMPNRIAMGATTWWDPYLAVVLTLIAIVGLVVLGGRIYAHGVLHTGGVLRLREAWRGSPAVAGTASTAPRRWEQAVPVAVAAVAGGSTIALSRDVIIGIAVAAATYAVAARAVKVHHRPTP